MSRVFVLGNASIDVTLPVARLPVPGETLMAGGIGRAPGGKGLNQAVVASRCGVGVHFCAPLGGEPETDMVRAALAGEDFAGVLLADVGVPADVSMILVAADGENCIVSTGACAEALPVAVATGFVAGMRAGDVLLVQGNLSQATTLAAAAWGGRVVFNTAPLRWGVDAVARLCAVVVANRVEAEQVTGLADPWDAVRRLGGGVGIVTLGEAGCVVADEAGVSAYPAVPVAAVDSSGAGDTFCGVLAASLALGCGMAEAVAAGQSAAAIAVGRAGCFAALPTRGELAAILRAVS